MPLVHRQHQCTERCPDDCTRDNAAVCGIRSLPPGDTWESERRTLHHIPRQGKRPSRGVPVRISFREVTCDGCRAKYDRTPPPVLSAPRLGRNPPSARRALRQFAASFR